MVRVLAGALAQARLTPLAPPVRLGRGTTQRTTAPAYFGTTNVQLGKGGLVEAPQGMLNALLAYLVIGMMRTIILHALHGTLLAPVVALTSKVTLQRTGSVFSS